MADSPPGVKRKRTFLLIQPETKTKTNSPQKQSVPLQAGIILKRAFSFLRHTIKGHVIDSIVEAFIKTR